MTKPGTVLRFGQKAIVPTRELHLREGIYVYGVMGIVVHRIQQAPGSKVEGNFDSEARKRLKSATAYYAKVTFTNESGDPLSPHLPEFDTLARGGDSPGFVLSGGELPGCPTESDLTQQEFGRKGAQWEGCVLGVSTSDRPIREIHYKEPPYGMDVEVWDWKKTPKPSRDDYIGPGPIVWR